jgi:hypothetical protein
MKNQMLGDDFYNLLHTLQFINNEYIIDGLDPSDIFSAVRL